MSVYRFPAYANENVALKDQLDKIKGELREAKCAEIRYMCLNEADDRMELCMELLDIIHATETALRAEYTEDEVEEARAKVIEKNARRMYYQGE